MALQDVLGSLTSPAASRQAILQRLGIDPNRAAGYGGNTQFDQQMADLYQKGLQGSTNLDIEEGNLNRSYQQNLAQAAVDRDKALKLLQGQYAQRGMTYSGANVEDVNQTGADYSRYTENLGEDLRSGLGAVSRNRANLEYGLGAGRQALEGGYGADLGAFLQQQAIDMWNAVTQQNQQNAMLQAMNRPAPAPAPARPAAPRPAAPRPVTPVRAPTPVLRGQGYSSRSRGPF